MKKISMAIASLCLAFSAYADDASAPQVEQGTLSFEELKLACQNPARFHNQIAPSNLQVSCKDVQYKWVPDEDGSIQMACARHVTASIQSDKYKTKAVMGTLPVASQTANCGRFKQVAETVETVRPTSCDELLAFKGTAIDFCAGAVNELRVANADAIRVTATGQTVNLCGRAAGNAR